MKKPSDRIEEIGGAVQAKPCLYTLETGKHEYTSLTFHSGKYFWVPMCPKCQFIDQDIIYKEYIEPLIVKERQKALEQKTKEGTQKVINEYGDTLKELGKL